MRGWDGDGRGIVRFRDFGGIENGFLGVVVMKERFGNEWTILARES